MRQFMGCDVLVCDSSPLRTLQAAIDFVRRNPHERQLCIHSRAYSEMLRGDWDSAATRDRNIKEPRSPKRCRHDPGAFTTGMTVGRLLQ